MTELINEALIPLRDELIPNIRSIISQITRTNTVIMNTYARLLNTGNNEQEDRDCLADLRHHHDLILHSLTHEADILEVIGTQRNVEKYYNFIDGEPVEVPKSEWVGLPDGADIIHG